MCVTEGMSTDELVLWEALVSGNRQQKTQGASVELWGLLAIFHRLTRQQWKTGVTFLSKKTLLWFTFPFLDCQESAQARSSP